MILKICIGSACHIKGSYDVIRRMKAYIEENNLNSIIELKSSFCLGKCGNAVSIQVDSNPIQSIRPDEVTDFMKTLKEKVDDEIH